jgi:3-mercaptopyruvate sulfurtransferase SseA
LLGNRASGTSQFTVPVYRSPFSYCKISTLAAATLRAMGYTRAVALDGGYDAWIKAGNPVEKR